MSKSKSRSRSKSPLMSETELQDLYNEASDMEVLLIKDAAAAAREAEEAKANAAAEELLAEEAAARVATAAAAEELNAFPKVPKDYKKMRKEYKTLEENENEILKLQRDNQSKKKIEILIKEKKKHDKKIQDNVIQLKQNRAEKKKIEEIFNTDQQVLKPLEFPSVPVKIKKATLIPAMKELNIIRKNNQIEVIIPSFSCHCAVSFEYE